MVDCLACGACGFDWWFPGALVWLTSWLWCGFSWFVILVLPLCN